MEVVISSHKQRTTFMKSVKGSFLKGSFEPYLNFFKLWDIQFIEKGITLEPVFGCLGWYWVKYNLICTFWWGTVIELYIILYNWKFTLQDKLIQAFPLQGFSSFLTMSAHKCISDIIQTKGGEKERMKT